MDNNNEPQEFDLEDILREFHDYSKDDQPEMEPAAETAPEPEAETLPQFSATEEAPPQSSAPEETLPQFSVPEAALLEEVLTEEAQIGEKSGEAPDAVPQEPTGMPSLEDTIRFSPEDLEKPEEEISASEDDTIRIDPPVVNTEPV